MRKQLEQLLEDKRIDLWWADETWPRRVRHGWVGVSDVACSRTLGAVAVPRRRRDSYHYAEVLHEVAHLERWRNLGISPSKDSEVEVCRMAIEIASEYRFEASVLGWLRQDLTVQERE